MNERNHGTPTVFEGSRFIPLDNDEQNSVVEVHADLESTEIIGSINRKAIRRVIQSHAEDIKQCFKTDKAFSHLNSKVVIHLIVLEHGTVGENYIKHSDLNSKTIESCLLQKLRKYYYPEPDTGERAEINIAFTFNFFEHKKDQLLLEVLRLFIKQVEVTLEFRLERSQVILQTAQNDDFKSAYRDLGADVAATLYTVIETAKKSGMQPKEYLKYLITERRHGRKPLSPHRLAVEKYGAKAKIDFPEKENWKI